MGASTTITIDQMRRDVCRALATAQPPADDDNLIEAGLGSLQIMRIANRWRRAGAPVTFAKLISRPTLRDWEGLAKGRGRRAGARTGSDATDAARSVQLEAAQPSGPAPAGAADGTTIGAGSFEPYPLTEVQYAYWVGRRNDQVLGGIGCHAYLELDGRDIDPNRLARAWEQVQRQHPLLHTRFTADGLQQTVCDFVPRPLEVTDLRTADPATVRVELAGIRERLSHRRLAVEDGENAGLALTLLPDDAHRIHYDIDLLSADVQSFQRVIEDVARSYAGLSLAPASATWDFGRYLAAHRREDVPEHDRDVAWWHERVKTLPPAPELPLERSPETVEVVRFDTRSATVDAVRWAAFRQQAAQAGVTPAIALLCAYALVLDRWSENAEFVLNVMLFSRDTSWPGAEDAVADFSDMVIVDVHVEPGISFAKLAERTQRTFHECVAHTACSGVEVVRALGARRGAKGSAAPVVFACNLGEELPGPLVRECLGGLGFMQSQTPQVWLDFQTFDAPGGALLLKFDYVRDLFSDQVIGGMFDCLGRLVGDLAEDSAAWEAEPVLAGADQAAREVIEQTLETAEVPNVTLEQGFFDYARRNPQKVALINASTGDRLSFGELATDALRVAAALQDSGVRGGENVAVTLPRGFDQVRAVLGVLAAGACYVPVGVRQPPARRARIFGRAGITHCVTTGEEAASGAFPQGTRCVVVSECGSYEPVGPVSVDPSSLAYIIFTSGSTGEPKGVQITHRGAMNTILDVSRRADVGEGDVAFASSALDFDLSVYDLFGVLGSGGCLVVPDGSRDPEAWLAAVNAWGVTVWNSVPALFDMVLRAAENQGQELRGLRCVMLSGDWIGLDLPGRLRERSDALLMAMGGATEASIWSNHYECEGPLPAGWNSVPYGRPLSNQRFAVVDARGRLCPPGVPGELLIGGAGVARGYCGAPELTAASFFSDEHGMPWYRTGDRGRFREGALIEFLGRRDFQVKVGGYRIELGEVERALESCPLVEHGVAGLRRDEAGSVLLAAYVVLDQGVEPGPEARGAISNFMGTLVPGYMVPTEFFFLDALPITANGKVDRKRLAALDDELGMAASSRFEPPVTPTEKALACVWQEVLGISRVSRTDSFFARGGDSLSAMRLNQAIGREFSVRLVLEELFSHAELADQACVIDAARASQAPYMVSQMRIEHDEGSRFEPFPLGSVQQAYWFGAHGFGGRTGVTTQYYREFRTTGVDPARLGRAVDAVVRANDMLRLEVAVDGSWQRVRRDVAPLQVGVVDLRGLDMGHAQSRLEGVRASLVDSLANQDGRAFALCLVELTDGQRVCTAFNNLVFDASSIFVFLDEVDAAYARGADAVGPVGIGFRDYVVSLAGERETEERQTDRSYWLKRVQDFPCAPELPYLDPLPDRSVFVHREHLVDGGLWARFKERALAARLTPTAALLEAYSEVLGLYSRDPRFALNLTRFNRRPVHEDIDRVIGDFTALVPLEVDLGSAGTFAQRAHAVQSRLLADLDHAGFDGVEFERELARARGQHDAALPVVFTSALGLEVTPSPGSLFSDRAYSSSQTAEVYLDHQVAEEGGALLLSWDAVDAAFPEGMVGRMFDTYCALVERLSKGDAVWEAQVASVAEEPPCPAVVAANDTTAPVPSDTLRSLVLRCVLEHGNRRAVCTLDQALTYAQLYARANAVAKMLVARGIDHGLVGVCLPKSIDQLVAVVGVVLSGAGYVPLDVGYPASRIADIVADAQPTAIITSAQVRQTGSFSEVSLPLLGIEGVGEESGQAFGREPDPSELAYVIFTSGSTGRPKGVAIPHRGVVNTILDVNRRFGVGPDDTVLALSSLCFDLSVYDLFGMVASGGCVALVEEPYARDPARWQRMVCELGVTVWNSVPAYLQMLLGMGVQGVLPLRLVMVSGDWIPLSLPGDLAPVAPSARFVGLGGATEASIWSNFFEVHEVEPTWRSIPYGRPLANQRFYVLNRQMVPCPVGVPGDLYIAGEGLAHGYLGNPERTRESFLEWRGQRVYRTGDLGRWDERGIIEFMGREDFQVKILGHRIELGEIESVVKGCEGVRDAVAVVTPEQQLVCFAVPDRCEAVPQGAMDALLGDVRDELDSFLAGLGVSPKELDAYYRRLAAVASGLSLQVLRALGIPLDGQRRDLDQLMDLGQVDPSYRTLLALWMRELASRGVAHECDGLVTFDSQGCERLMAALPSDDLWGGLLARLRTRYLAMVPRVVAMLRGQADPVSMMAEGDMGLMPAAMEPYDVSGPCLYAMVRRIVDAARQRARKEGRTLRVAELGTRFGSLAATVLAGATDIEYTYLEPSAYFVAQRRAQLPGTSFDAVAFDVNESPCAQGLACGAYDILLADNTLHRAHDVDVALRNVRPLLSERGFALVIEQTSNSAFVLDTAGLLEEGFKGFVDERSASHLPLLDVGRWRAHFQRGGWQVAAAGDRSDQERALHAALYVACPGQPLHEVQEGDVLAQAARHLPDYLMPKRVVVLDQMPTTSNGKVDRKALSTLAQGYVTKVAGARSEPPATSTEEALVCVWREVLGRDDLGVTDSFFEAGGDSLTAVQCVNRCLTEKGIRVSLQDLFRLQTVRALGASLEEARGDEEELVECGVI